MKGPKPFASSDTTTIKTKNSGYKTPKYNKNANVPKGESKKMGKGPIPYRGA